MATYAHDTKVPVSKSRADIEHLLKRWGCDGRRWTEDDRARLVTCEFRWRFEGVDYGARFRLQLPSDEVLVLQFKRTPTALQLQTAREQRWRALHRVLLLTITAELNAVEAGLKTAPEAFLPYLVGADGLTIAEVAIPRLRQLYESGAAALLDG